MIFAAREASTPLLFFSCSEFLAFAPTRLGDEEFVTTLEQDQDSETAQARLQAARARPVEPASGDQRVRSGVPGTPPGTPRSGQAPKPRINMLKPTWHSGRRPQPPGLPAFEPGQERQQKTEGDHSDHEGSSNCPRESPGALAELGEALGRTA